MSRKEDTENSISRGEENEKKYMSEKCKIVTEIDRRDEKQKNGKEGKESREELNYIR